MSAPNLLVVIDPVARATDGESVRIAKDVLCAGADEVKVCVPQCAAEMERVLARRGGRRPVLVGDDRALLHMVRLLHRERELAACALAVVPVGTERGTTLARSLGVPGGAVAASRAALHGSERAMDLLVDDSGGVVLGALRVPARGGRPGGATGEAGVGPGGGAGGSGREPASREPPGDGVAPGAEPAAGGLPGGDGPGARATEGPGPGGRSGRGRAAESRAGGADAARDPLLRCCRSFVRSLTRPLPLLGALAGGPGAGLPGGHVAGFRLRVEADGATLVDLDRPVAGVWVAPDGDGMAVVTVRRRAASDPLYARARTVTVSGPDFRYRADALVGGPVRARTWTVLDSAWRLTVPDA